LKGALQESCLEALIAGLLKDVDLNPKEHDENEPLPVVDGEIEVVEVKSGNPHSD